MKCFQPYNGCSQGYLSPELFVQLCFSGEVIASAHMDETVYMELKRSCGDIVRIFVPIVSVPEENWEEVPQQIVLNELVQH